MPSRTELHRLARLGAQVRLAELIAEIDAILAAFPDLGSMPARPKASGSEVLTKGKRRKRYRMSVANRNAAAERMRAYWARKRQEGTKQPRKAR